MRVLCFDPSGSFHEGEGCTGWAVFEDGELKDFGRLEAKKCNSIEEYFWAHCLLIDSKLPNTIVCESYKLFGHKAKQQSWSEMETPQLIGALRLRCWVDSIALVFQDPKDKVRVADPILVHMGVLEQSEGNRYKALGRQTVIHERDAIRHGVFWHRYNKEKVK